MDRIQEIEGRYKPGVVMAYKKDASELIGQFASDVHYLLSLVRSAERLAEALEYYSKFSEGSNVGRTVNWNVAKNAIEDWQEARKG